MSGKMEIPKPNSCPKCRGTQFSIEVPTVWLYDGEKKEVVETEGPLSEPNTYQDVPAFDRCFVQCRNCEWTGKVSDLRTDAELTVSDLQEHVRILEERLGGIEKVVLGFEDENTYRGLYDRLEKVAEFCPSWDQDGDWFRRGHGEK